MLRRATLPLLMAVLFAVGLAIASAADEPKTSEKRDTMLYVHTVPSGAKVLLNGNELGTSDEFSSSSRAWAGWSLNWADTSRPQSRSPSRPIALPAWNCCSKNRKNPKRPPRPLQPLRQKRLP